MQALRSPAIRVNGLAVEGGHLSLYIGVQHPLQEGKESLFSSVGTSAEFADGPKGDFRFLCARGERVQKGVEPRGLGRRPEGGQNPLLKPVE